MEIQQRRYSNGDTAAELQQWSSQSFMVKDLFTAPDDTLPGRNVGQFSWSISGPRFQMMARHGVNAASFSFYWQLDGETISTLSNSHGVSAASFSFHRQQ